MKEMIEMIEDNKIKKQLIIIVVKIEKRQLDIRENPNLLPVILDKNKPTVIDKIDKRI
jgi:hypothetical protein